MQPNTNSPPSPATESPLWIRIPQAVNLTGLSRSKLYELLAEGRIRSASLRDPGQRHATRLIDRADLLRFLDGFATGGNAK
jgi:excisionase family DNA binding protein